MKNFQQFNIFYSTHYQVTRNPIAMIRKTLNHEESGQALAILNGKIISGNVRSSKIFKKV